MPTDRPSSALASLVAWLCLLGGLALLGGLTLAAPLVDWEAARRERLAAELAADRARSKADRLERLLAAVRTNRLFREEWVRVEWERPPSESAVALPGELRIDPRLPASGPTVMPMQPAWTLPLERLLESALLFRGFSLAAAAAIATGLLTRPHRGAGGVVVSAVRHLGRRYRHDGPHRVPPPHLPREDVAAVVELPQTLES